jgi:hypothetical protein
VKEKPTVGSQILAAFASDRIPKTTKDVDIPFFIRVFSHAAVSLNYTSEFLLITPTTSGNYLKLLRRELQPRLIEFVKYFGLNSAIGQVIGYSLNL